MRAPHRRLLALASLFALALAAACKPAPPPDRDVPGGTAALGPAAIQKYGCGTCHIIPGIPGANGRVAQPLLGFSDRSDIGGAIANTPEGLLKWIQDPQSLNRTARMPKLGVTDQDARDIAAYLYTLKTR